MGTGVSLLHSLFTVEEILLHILTAFALSPMDLAALEMTCTLFARPCVSIGGNLLTFPEHAARKLYLRQHRFTHGSNLQSSNVYATATATAARATKATPKANTSTASRRQGSRASRASRDSRYGRGAEAGGLQSGKRAGKQHTADAGVFGPGKRPAKKKGAGAVGLKSGTVARRAGDAADAEGPAPSSHHKVCATLHYSMAFWYGAVDVIYRQWGLNGLATAGA